MLIYLIKNKINGKGYIGQTRRSLLQRWSVHIADAKRVKQSPLARAIRKYGAENFSLKAIANATSLSMLNDLEIISIKDYKTKVPYGYNIKDGGANNNVSDETRKRMSMARKGKRFSLEHKARLSAALKGRERPWLFGNAHNLGKKCSEETRKRISRSLFGNQYAKGFKHSIETRMKISLAGKGKNRSPKTEEHCRNISIAKIGKKRGIPWTPARRAAQERLHG